MSYEPLPDDWSDDPWPLDDLPGSPLRPRNWSDTHGPDLPQAADLADEAWQYAVDHRCSLEQALVTLQRREVLAAEISGTVPGGTSVNSVPIGVPLGWAAPPTPQTWPKPDDPWIWSEPERDGDDLSVTITIGGAPLTSPSWTLHSLDPLDPEPGDDQS